MLKRKTFFITLTIATCSAAFSQQYDLLIREAAKSSTDPVRPLFRRTSVCAAIGSYL
jgi:hypothetical protein